jgi:hypothetical protein
VKDFSLSTDSTFRLLFLCLKWDIIESEVRVKIRRRSLWFLGQLICMYNLFALMRSTMENKQGTCSALYLIKSIISWFGKRINFTNWVMTLSLSQALNDNIMTKGRLTLWCVSRWASSFVSIESVWKVHSREQFLILILHWVPNPNSNSNMLFKIILLFGIMSLPIDLVFSQYFNGDSKYLVPTY